MRAVEAEGSGLSTNLVDWWGKGVFLFLCFSILLLGVGRFELPFSGARFSAWSTSRTTFFFWLIWKILIWRRLGRQNLGLNKSSLPLPLLAFFTVVTVSLLPDFHGADDYRYFLFAVLHCVMILDLFGANERPKLLLFVLGVLPGLLVIRGILSEPSVLNLSLLNRFEYPVAHPNSAGLVFSMSIPLALTIIVSQRGWLRSLTFVSLAAQFSGLILTYSRSAWLGCVVSLVAIALLESSLRKVVLALGLLGLVAFLSVAPLRSRLLSMVNPTDDLAIDERFQFMTRALAVGLENPLLGVGYGRDRLREGIKKTTADSTQIQFIPHSHNLYIELFAEIGLVGLGAFMWMILSNLSRLILRARRQLSAPIRIRYFCLGASLFAFLVSVLGDAPFYDHHTRIYFLHSATFDLFIFAHRCP